MRTMIAKRKLPESTRGAVVVPAIVLRGRIRNDNRVVLRGHRRRPRR